MRHLLLFIVSYGSLLLLLMPSTATGILAAAIALFLGIAWIIRKQLHKIAFWETKRYPLIFCSIFSSAVLGYRFNDLWLTSSKLQHLAAALHIPFEPMILVGTLVVSILAVYVIYAILQTLEKKSGNTNPKKDFAGKLLCCVAASIVTVCLAQCMIDTKALCMGFLNFFFGVLIVLAVILFFYCLFGKIMPTILLGSGLFMLLSTINAYVYRFRERLFEPIDIFSADTAMNVIGNYSLLPISPGLLMGWGGVIVLLIVVFFSQRKSKSKLSAKKRLALLSACIVSAVAVFFYSANLEVSHWDKDGAYTNGYILDFVSKFKEISAPKPDNYSTELIAELAEQYAADENIDNINESEAEKPPHVIVIMDEAFSDLSLLGDFSTNAEVAPFISSLKENTISGYVLASVFGGNTANSEYEFLTGNSLAWLSPNAVPFQQYVRSSSYSMVSYLKTLYDYRCIAMHPYEANGWNRPAAYQHFGFDQCYFMDDFPQANYLRRFISDQEMVDFLIDVYEAQKDDLLFIFGVTMQNHGGYYYKKEDFTNSISLNDYDDYFDVEQYLSLIHETDKAVERLITYFEGADEDVVVVFFGDHQPYLNESFYEAIGSTTDTLDEQQKRYMVPFFIWANYDIEEKQVDCTSLNYLSSYVYEAAGIALPPYNQFLREMEGVIPSINANGFYSVDDACYLPIDAANGEAQAYLELYEALQYNNIFDKKNRNEALFPVVNP